MKKWQHIVIVLAAVFSSTFFISQTSFNNYYNYPGHENTQTRLVLHTPDSGCVFAGFIHDTVADRFDLGFTRLDKHGNALIQKMLSLNTKSYGSPYDGLKNFVPATSCSYFFSAVYTSDSTGFLSSIIYKINRSTLDTMRSLFYEDTCHVSLSNILKIHENKYYLVGTKSNTAITIPFILHVDSNLNIVNKINIINPNEFFMTSAVYNPDKKRILLSGYNYNVGYGIQTPETFMHVDTLGNPISAVTVTAAPYGYGRWISQIFYSHNDSSYVILGAKATDLDNLEPPDPSFMRLMIGKLDAQFLTSRWHKMYGWKAFSNTLQNAIIFPNGDITACGFYSKYGVNTYYEDYGGGVVKTDKDGNLLCFKNYNMFLADSSVTPSYSTLPYPTNRWEIFTGIDTTADGAYVFCGDVYYQPMSWVNRTDSLACDTAAIPVEDFAVIINTVNISPPIVTGILTQVEKKLNLLIYPNPVKETVNVQVMNFNEVLELKITDVTGRQMKQISFIKNAKVDVSALSPGVYYFELYSKGKILRTEKMIRE